MRYLKLTLAAALLAAAVACTIDFETGTIPAPDQMEGTWGGYLQDAAGVMHTVTLTFDDSGRLILYRVDGTDTGRRGRLNGPNQTGTLFSLSLDDGTLGGVLADPAYTHAAFLDRDGNVGVLEKDAAPGAVFGADDILQPMWLGHYLELNADLSFSRMGGSQLEVGFTGIFLITDGDGRMVEETAGLSLTDPGHGRYQGAYVNLDDPLDAGVAVVLLTPDKTHGGGYTCNPDERALPDGCRFFLWSW